MISHQLQTRILSGLGSVRLKRFCGKSSNKLKFLFSSIRKSCGDERTSVEVDFEKNFVLMRASLQNMGRLLNLVKEGLEYEKTLLRSKYSEECLYIGVPGMPIALFGAGAQIKHLELDNRYLSVDIFHSNITALDERKLLQILEEYAQDHICAISKFSGNVEDKWGRVTFSSPDAASKVADLKEEKFCGGLLKIIPSRNLDYGGDHKRMPVHSFKSKIVWPCGRSSGSAILKCDPKDVTLIMEDLYDLDITGMPTRCEKGFKEGSILLTSFDKELSEADIYAEITASTNRQITDFFLLRRPAVDPEACKEAIERQISPFMPRKNQHNYFSFQVLQPEPNDILMRAEITFNGNLHLEAARALEHIDGIVLPGFPSW